MPNNSPNENAGTPSEEDLLDEAWRPEEKAAAATVKNPKEFGTTPGGIDHLVPEPDSARESKEDAE
jgi:hypothetical protein